MKRLHPAHRVTGAIVLAGVALFTMTGCWPGVQTVGAASARAVAQVLCLLFWPALVALAVFGVAAIRSALTRRTDR